VFFRSLTRCEGPKISPLSGFGVLLSRVQAVLTCFEFPDHFSVLLWVFNRPTQRSQGAACRRLGGTVWFDKYSFIQSEHILLKLVLCELINHGIFELVLINKTADARKTENCIFNMFFKQPHNRMICAK
jgi:hypothetical protein